MNALFELEWFGGVSGLRARKRRGGVDELPWGTLDVSRYEPSLIEHARVSWTQSAFREYCTAASFAELSRALLAARAPIDFVAMAGDFVADEIVHVELNARMAMELGGAVPLLADFDALVEEPGRELTPVQRANELVVRVCCVAEAYSVPTLAATYRAATHPLPRAILERIVRDEAPHARLGSLYLEWVAPALDDDERARLAGVARRAIDGHCSPCLECTSAAFDADPALAELGWMTSSAYLAASERALTADVLPGLSRYGIVVPATAKPS